MISLRLVAALLLALIYSSIKPLLDPSQFGMDLSRYYSYYNSIDPSTAWTSLQSTLSLSSSNDPLFYFFILVIKTLHIPFTAYLFLQAFLMIYVLLRILFSGFKGAGSYILLVPFCLYVLLFLQSVTLVTIRQGLAIIYLITFYLPLLFNRMWGKSAVALLISTLIHGSCIILLPFHVLVQRKKLNLTRFLFLILTILIPLYCINLFPVLVSKLTIVDLSFLRALANTEDHGYKTGFSPLKLITILLPLCSYYLARSYVQGDGYKNFLHSYMFYIFMIGIIFSGFPYYDRVLLFGWIISPSLVIPNLYYLIRHKLKIFAL